MSSIPVLLRTLSYLKADQLLNTFSRKLYRKIPCKPLIRYKKIGLKLQSIDTQKDKPFYDETLYQQGQKWNAELPLQTYHRNYFDFIYKYPAAEAIEIMHQWIESNKDYNELSWDPYPLSLRIVNIIRYLCQHDINDKLIDDSLYLQASYLFRRREFHLQSNHIFKNVTALLYAGHYFNNSKWQKWALKELQKRLQEQLTEDNYHFELSPTYHALFVKDLLEIYDLLVNNTQLPVAQKIKDILPASLYWCSYFSSKDILLPVNDANYFDCPTPCYLNSFAAMYNIEAKAEPKINHQYPLLFSGKLKLMFYAAAHQPAYNPAHSHDDLSSFLLWYKDEPVLVDTGNYCYDETKERRYSRSTAAHNCFTVNGADQSEMWKVFRIGRRAKIIDLQITDSSIVCSHNGYRAYLKNYQRQISAIENDFEIVDSFLSHRESEYAVYFHFHPQRKLELCGNVLKVDNELELEFSSSNIEIICTDFYPAMYCRQQKKTIVAKGSVAEKQHKTIIRTKL